MEKTYKVYKLYSEEQSYYGRTTLKPNLCYNLLASYYSQRKNVFDDIFSGEEHTFEIVHECNDKNTMNEKYCEFIQTDDKCVNKKNKNHKKEETKEQKLEKARKYYHEHKDKMKEYNKKAYEKNKQNGKSKDYYQENKDKIKQYNKKKYELLKSKLEKLKELETK